ncbi:MAG: hypothetical protein QM778_15860 [Myxococcales bacterium]
MSTKRRTLASLVMALPCLLQGLALAEAPEGSSHADFLQKGPPRPPAEAFAACEGKADGDTCEVSFRGETHAGTCIAPKTDELFCMPNDMPPPPHGGEPPPRR